MSSTNSYFEGKTLLPCRIEGNMFQTVIWTMECPGKPQVTLLAECHVGTRQYFQALHALLGQTTPRVWVGIESMQRAEDVASLKPKIRSRVRVLRHEIDLRDGLATSAGLVARHVDLSKEGRTIIGPRDDEFVANWGIKRSLLMRFVNGRMQKLVDECKAGNTKAVQQCRTQVIHRLRGIARFVQMPERVGRSIAEDTLWNDSAFNLMTAALNEGRKARLQMGALHIMAIRPMLERQGYKLATEEWLDCADLALLA